MMHPDLAVAFRGERYVATDRLSRLIAPPYDVISPAQRARYAALEAHNIVRLTLPEAPGEADRYAHAAAQLAAWRDAGVLTRDLEPAAYVLSQDFALPSGERRTRLGVFVALAAEGYEPRRVRPHERTHAGPKADRLALLRATLTSLESIFVIAPDPDGALAAALRAATALPPAARAELDGVGIRLWVVPGTDGARLAALAGAGPVYIADGHHRYETASAYARELTAAARVLALVVSASDDGLAVLPTHRIIHGAPVHPEELAPAWRARFDAVPLGPGADPIEHLAAAGRQGTACVVVWPERRAEVLTLKAGVDVGDLPDVAVARVESLVVRPIVLRAGTAELTYTADAREALDAVWKAGGVAAVLLNPTKVAEVFRVADAGGIMPPKSTYFIPKVPAGVLLNPL
jgi:uncharacterized protein (DUF1015 family)